MFIKSRGFTTRLVAATLAAAIVVPAPASAQFGGLFKKRSSTETADSSSNTDCANDTKSSIGKSILGNMIGDFTRRATGSLGMAGSFIPRAEVADTLTNAIACQLDPDEQLQAAEATRNVTRSEQIGTSSEWKSQTRPGVSGSSTATAKTRRADGRSCMTITDVVIVDGEESRVSKQMCKNPGETRYIVVV
jgi:surface antigen|tara:strand:- start:12004 stop:12576 length:573 start_codon:yes stop_codon:yes gene_type:complete